MGALDVNFQAAMETYRSRLTPAEAKKIFDSRSMNRDTFLQAVENLRLRHLNSVPSAVASLGIISERILSFSSAVDNFVQVAANPACIIWGNYQSPKNL